MREILFRGKTYDGKWEQGDLRHGGYVHNDSETYIMRADYALHNIPVDPKTVGQYTGLTDKNGTKIFEGDIVILPEDVRKACVWNDTAFIKYVDGEFRYVPTPKNNQVNCWEVRICDSNKQLEVISNIHDNPELLGGEE